MERDEKLRMLKYGILSSLISTVLATILNSEGPWGLGFIGVGSGAPLLILSSVFYSASPGLLLVPVAIWWFLIGIYIERVTSNRRNAILMWIGCQLIHFVIVIPRVVGMIA